MLEKIIPQRDYASCSAEKILNYSEILNKKFSLMAAILAEGAGRDVESTSAVLNGSTLTVSFALLPAN
jgi:hypothetical protein